ncbi:MAG: TonB-dependent receptor domain-containing protein, partial [Candidatus Zixiibacteriota bacterium]
AFRGGVSARTSGVFVSDRLAVAERLFVSAGIRYDNHETFGGKTTYRVSASYAVEESGTRFRASFATGFNAPGIFQLFDPSFGNTDLRAEESKSWEVGVDQSTLGDRLNFGALWFKADFTDLFGFDPNTFQTVNINESEAEGAEAFAQYTYTNLSARLDYTYTRAVDNSDGAQLIRRPRNKVSGRVTLRPSDRFAASLSVTHIGSRADLDFDSFPSVRVRLDPYTLVTLGGSIELSDLWRVSGRVENLFDEDYQEALFFGAPGRALYLGARLTP